MARRVRTMEPWWRRRWIWAVVAAVVVLRAAVPVVLRRVLVSQASEALGTRVEVGDLDLALHRGGVTLEDVAIHSPTPQAPGEPPLVAWKRFTVEVRTLPLLWKTVRLRTLELVAPRVALDRLATGELNLQSILPASEPPTAAATTSSEDEMPDGTAADDTAVEENAPQADEWKIGIDRLLLTAGTVRFRDLVLPQQEPLEVHLPDVSIDGVSFQPGVYGEPARARLRMKSEGARVWIDGTLRTLDSGFAVATHVKALRLPLHRAHLYVPGVGWSEFTGRCDAALDYRLSPAPDEHHEVHGMVRLRDVAIRIPDLEDSAFTLRQLTLRVAPLDLKARLLRMRAVDIDAASVVIDLQGGDVLPLLRPPARKTPRDEIPSDEPGATTAESPWRWELASLSFRDSRVRLLQEGDPLDVGVQATLRDLSGDDAEPGHVAATLTVLPGSFSVEGAARVRPPGFAGRVQIEQLPLDELARAARAAVHLPPGLLRHARLGADLAVEAGLDGKGAPPTDPHALDDQGQALRAQGNVTLDEVEIAATDPDEFNAGWKHLDVPIDGVRVPGVLQQEPSEATTAPLRVTLGAVRLEEPFARLTRAAEGIRLPPPLGPAPAANGASADSSDGTAEPAEVESEPPSESDSAASGRDLEATVSSFEVSQGRVHFTDRTVEPFFTGELSAFDLDARSIDLDGPTVERFTLSATTPDRGTLRASGSLRGENGDVEVTGQDVALPPYNPFLTTHSPYSLGRNSKLRVHSEVSMARNRYEAETTFTLHQLTVKGAQGNTLFKEEFGVPLSLAMALLRDLNGDIKLDVPMTIDEKGTSVGIGKIIVGALRRALLGAVTSPLKLIGGTLGEGGAIESPSVEFPVGRAELTTENEKHVGHLAAFLASRPGITLELHPVVTAADERWLAEQDLRAELDARSGVINALRGLRERGARLRIQEALAQRAVDETAELSTEDEALLDEWIAERPAVTPERLRALAVERMNAIAVPLRERHGIPPVRLLTTAPTGAIVEGEPSVEVAFGAVGS